jgi:hypothetical protein
MAAETQMEEGGLSRKGASLEMLADKQAPSSLWPLGTAGVQIPSRRHFLFKNRVQFQFRFEGTKRICAVEYMHGKKNMLTLIQK